MICMWCGTDMPRGRMQCQSCRMWNHSAAERYRKGAIAVAKLSSVSREASSYVRYPVGPLTYVLNGGALQSSLILLGGGEGTGKSTLCLQAAEAGRTLYIAAEERPEEVASRADRIGVASQDLIDVLPALGSDADATINAVSTIGEPYALLIVDSLTGLCSRDIDRRSELLTTLKARAVELGFAAIVLEHATKSEDISGWRSERHAVDAVCWLTTLNDGVRELTTLKNRGGPAPTSCLLAMTATGLSVV